MQKRKSAIGTIFRKELARFFGDKRMAFSTILLPGLMIYVMYSFMGSALTSQFSVEDTYTPSIQVVQPSAQVLQAAQVSGLALTSIEADQLPEAQAALAEQTLDLCVVFPQDFDTAVAGYEAQSQAPAPRVEIYFNSASTHSQAAYQQMTALLDGYESSLANKFDVNAGEGPYDLASDKDNTASFFASMLPMLLMIFLFSGCMAVAPESIAGEKERGTIAALLITPARRSDIAFGKIAALSVIALLSGFSSALGTILALPKLLGGSAEIASGSVYSMAEYAQLGGVILSTVLVLVTVISLISAFARTVKEAQTYVTPLMILCMLVGITAMFGAGAKSELFYYFIPLYNSVQCMVGIFSFSAVPGSFTVCLAANLIWTGLGTWLLTRMFNSERVMFAR